MSKKRNKNILVPAMPGYDLRFNPLYSSSDEKVDCVKINCQAGKNCKNLPKLEFGKEDFCIFTQVQSSWDEGYWG